MDFQPPPPASFLLNFLFRPRPQVPLLANATSVQVLIIGAVPHVSYGTWRQWRLDGLQYQVWPLEWRWRWKGSTRWSNADQRHQGEGKTCMEIFIFIIFLWFICMMCNLSSDSSGLEEYRDKHLDKGAGKKKIFLWPVKFGKSCKRLSLRCKHGFCCFCSSSSEHSNWLETGCCCLCKLCKLWCIFITSHDQEWVGVSESGVEWGETIWLSARWLFYQHPSD